MHVDLEDYLKTNDLKLKEILMIMKDSTWSADDGTPVDGSIWYGLSAKSDVSTWIRETFADSKQQLWFDTGSTHTHIQRFDIHETIYTQLLLRWPSTT